MSSKISSAIYAITHLEGPAFKEGDHARYRDAYLNWNSAQMIASFVTYALGAYIGYQLMQMSHHKVLTGAAILIGAPASISLVGAIGRKLDPTESRLFDKLYPETPLKTICAGMMIGTGVFAASKAVATKQIGAIAYTGLIAYLTTILAIAGAMTPAMVDGEKASKSQVDW